MPPVCMFDILELPQNDLKRVLPKASSRTLVRLLTAYPRSVGETFLGILRGCVSAPTLDFLREEIDRSQLPSFPQIREAESEILKIIEQEHLSLPDQP